jgi:hypothetical protein
MSDTSNGISLNASYQTCSEDQFHFHISNYILDKSGRLLGGVVVHTPTAKQSGRPPGRPLGRWPSRRRGCPYASGRRLLNVIFLKDLQSNTLFLIQYGAQYFCYFLDMHRLIVFSSRRSCIVVSEGCYWNFFWLGETYPNSI